MAWCPMCEQEVTATVFCYDGARRCWTCCDADGFDHVTGDPMEIPARAAPALYTLAQLQAVVEMQQTRVAALTEARLTGEWTQPYDEELDKLNEAEYQEGLILEVLEREAARLEEAPDGPTN